MEFDIKTLLTKDKKTIKEESKNRGGRPKVAEPKNKKVMSNFTQKEYEALKEQAQAQDVSVATFIRRAVLEKLLSL